MTQRFIDATNKDDVRLLATCFMTAPQSDRWKLVAKVHELGLMKFKNFNCIISLIRWWKGEAGVYTFFKIISDKFPETIDFWIEDTIRHIVNGTDTYDSASVGGWCQDEIDLLLSEVSFSALDGEEYV